MKLPYNRPRLIELTDLPIPPAIRDPIHDILTFLWLHRIWPLQPQAPYIALSDLLERMIEDDDAEVIDFCSGAGGPIPYVERRIKCARASLI